MEQDGPEPTPSDRRHLTGLGVSLLGNSALSGITPTNASSRTGASGVNARTTAGTKSNGSAIANRTTETPNERDRGVASTTGV